MNHKKELLVLIEEGDAVTILSQVNIVERLNELFTCQLIKYKDGKIYLTELGKEFIKEST